MKRDSTSNHEPTQKLFIIHVIKN